MVHSDGIALQMDPPPSERGADGEITCFSAVCKLVFFTQGDQILNGFVLPLLIGNGDGVDHILLFGWFAQLARRVTRAARVLEAGEPLQVGQPFQLAAVPPVKGLIPGGGPKGIARLGEG